MEIMTSSCLGGCKRGAEADQNQSWAAVLPLCGHSLPLQCPSCSGFAQVFICCEIWEQIWVIFGGGWGGVVLHIHTKPTQPVPGKIPAQPLAIYIPLAPSSSLLGKPPHCSVSSTLTGDRAQSISWQGTIVQSEVDTAMGTLYVICSAWTFLRTQEGGIFMHVLTSQQENFSSHFGTSAKTVFSVSKLQ